MISISWLEIDDWAKNMVIRVSGVPPVFRSQEMEHILKIESQRGIGGYASSFAYLCRVPKQQTFQNIVPLFPTN